MRHRVAATAFVSVVAAIALLSTSFAQILGRIYAASGEGTPRRSFPMAAC